MFLTTLFLTVAEDIVDLLDAAGQGITAWLTIFVGAIKSAFMNLLYEDPTATEKSLSGVMLYLFIFFGVNVVVGIVWFILSLAKRRGK